MTKTPLIKNTIQPKSRTILKSTMSLLRARLQATATRSSVFFAAVCVITTFATAGSIVVIPWAIGQLGYILGPVLLVGTVLMNLYFFTKLLDVVDNCKAGSCKTLGEVGYQLGGTGGRNLFVAFQMGNLILYMPVALETVGLSLQYVVDGLCLGWWNIASFAGLLVMVQFFTCWRSVAWVAYVTVAIAAAKSFARLPYSFVKYQDDIVTSEDYQGPIQPFLNPEPSWDLLALACSAFFFAFAPVFVFLEVRSDMRHPNQCKKALGVSATIQVIMYLAPALVCVVLWGWNVSSPITLEIPRGLLGIIMSLILVLAVALDYCISAKIINDWLIQCFPSSLKNMRFRSWCEQMVYKLAYSVPTSLLSLALVVAIPTLQL